MVYSDGRLCARLKFVAKQRWALVMIGLGVLLLIPGLIVFARTGGGVTPALLIGLVLLLVGAFIRGRGPINEGTPPIRSTSRYSRKGSARCSSLHWGATAWPTLSMCLAR
jgi:hypothetical protein